MSTAIGHLLAVVGLAVRQVLHYRSRSVLAIVAIALAVLSATLLVSVGFGVLDAGERKFDAAGRDLWVSGEAIEFTPGGVGTTLVGAHRTAAAIEHRQDVRNAVPLAFQAVYVANESTSFKTVVGVGVSGGGSAVTLTEGRGFERGDVHYANGSYDGPMTRTAVVDQRTAALLDLEPGDTIHVGGSMEAARRNEFTVVGISPTFSQFLGAPTVAVHLSELQEVTGTTGTDPATFITVTLAEDADPAQVRAELQRQYPSLQIRTNREQLRAVLGHNAQALAAAVALVLVGVVAGVTLSTNVIWHVVSQQRPAFAALVALGLSRRTLVSIAAWHGIVLGVGGGTVGLLATPPLVEALNYLAERIVGFENLLATPPVVYALGGAVALLVGATSAVVVGWRVSKTASTEVLE